MSHGVSKLKILRLYSVQAKRRVYTLQSGSKGAAGKRKRPDAASAVDASAGDTCMRQWLHAPELMHVPCHDHCAAYKLSSNNSIIPAMPGSPAAPCLWHTCFAGLCQ